MVCGTSTPREPEEVTQMTAVAIAPGTSLFVLGLFAAWLVTPWLLIPTLLLVLLQGLDYSKYMK